MAWHVCRASDYALLRPAGRPVGIRCVDRAETGPDGFQCVRVHLFLHPFEEDLFFFPNMCLQTLAKSRQPLFKTGRWVLLKLSDSCPHVVVFFTQLAHQDGPVSEVFCHCGKEMLFFRLEVPSQIGSEEFENPVYLLSSICGPVRAWGLRPTKDQPLSHNKSVVVIT